MFIIYDYFFFVTFFVTLLLCYFVTLLLCYFYSTKGAKQYCNFPKFATLYTKINGNLSFK